MRPSGERPPRLLARPGGKLVGRRARILARGNDKIGSDIFAFNLPAVRTCPAMSAACRSECYARRNRWRFPGVKAALRRNLDAARRADFAEQMAREIVRRGVAVIRIHASGDFFSEAYVRQWTAVAAVAPAVTLYAYTRSWRVPAIREALEEFAALPNVRIWYSADRDTGLPGRIPAGVRIAWLETVEEEDIPPEARLVFRPHRLRRRENSRVPVPLVCPADMPRPGTRVTCDSCGRCWQ